VQLQLALALPLGGDAMKLNVYHSKSNFMWSLSSDGSASGWGL